MKRTFTCGATGASDGLMDIRFVYNFGALLRTTGVGSELYDFSGGAEWPCGMNVGINDGAIGGGGTWFMTGGTTLDGGCCCNFC